MKWTAQLRTALMATALLTNVIHPAAAQSGNAPAATALFNYISKIEGLDRRGLASVVSNYCTEVLQMLPRNTPREDDWVDEELRSGNWDRIARASQSVENVRKTMVWAFTECTSHSTKLIRASQATAEAVLWTRLAMTFSSSTISQDAERLGLARYDEKTGWNDPHLLKGAPLAIVFQAHIAVIESLGQKLSP